MPHPIWDKAKIDDRIARLRAAMARVAVQTALFDEIDALAPSA